jgi:hypothetical protein
MFVDDSDNDTCDDVSDNNKNYSKWDVYIEYDHHHDVYDEMILDMMMIMIVT